MNILTLLGFAFVILVFGMIITFTALGRKQGGFAFREIPAFVRLRRAVGLAVEAGARLQVNLGWGNPVSTEFASGLVGLTVLDRIARAASVSDNPPVATSGEGAHSILSQDTFRSAYGSLGIESQYDPTMGRLVGLTPFGYAAGVLPVIFDEQVSTNAAIGHLTEEVALINDASMRKGNLTIAGSDSLPGQAVIYATAEEPLIGEEVFAGGAYLGASPAHEASLRSQDILRLILIALLLISALGKLFGIDQLLLDLFPGLNP
ncbi:MAG: hypothetical protein EHM41_02780 [Chloroflexi bacterium]|nr:MAG: hypothetical protein EHM41_02780 [Chloroflexota bacterium]